MIIGIGVDLVSIEKIAESIKSEAFRRKVFTSAEIESCESIANATERYAGKFAAKEAFMKAIGKGIRQEVWFTQIEVLNHGTGAPYIQVSGEAEKTSLLLGVEKMHISISHAEGMAVAMIVLSTNS
ncbi:MAG: holo-ACP synthase [Anaerolineae bacterium]|jgi:holo-[acyl-carrier protein] synthase|nr:holo-ACP synthase [Anaerolineae bacterium]MBT7190426.1 holo-ACP synthase [Anaerolineae bacterium]MBT7324035.1 holo-ACP synthase [Anaerolineae bacterium]MBT7602221.1 holo-ACP synthase [Anaerolineae bacterium]